MGWVEGEEIAGIVRLGESKGGVNDPDLQMMKKKKIKEERMKLCRFNFFKIWVVKDK